MSSHPNNSLNQGGQAIFCPNCGFANPPQGRFCTRCGYHFAQQVPPAQPAMQRPPQQLARRSQSPPTKAPPFVELWWVRIPVTLRRFSILLSETWHDGTYLTAWPSVALFAPFVALLIGVLEGVTHWNPFTIPDATASGSVAAAFTEMLLLMIIAAIVGALSTNLGFCLVLGYALGDLFLPHERVPYYGGGVLPSTDFTALIYPYFALIISYILFFFLAVTPTLTTKYLTTGLRTILKGAGFAPTLLRIGIVAAVQGGLVYAWTLAAPLLIRVIWGDGSPPNSAAYYLQVTGGWVVGAAVVATLARGLIAYRAYQDRAVVQRVMRLSNGFRAADARLAFTRRIPGIGRALLTAASMTLLITGFIANFLEALIVFLFVAVIFTAREVVLPRLGFWVAWANLLKRVPLLIRLGIGAFLVYLIAKVLLTIFWTQPVLIDTASGSFQWILISMCLSIVVITILAPRIQSTPTRSATQSAVRPA